MGRVYATAFRQRHSAFIGSLTLRRLYTRSLSQIAPGAHGRDVQLPCVGITQQLLSLLRALSYGLPIRPGTRFSYGLRTRPCTQTLNHLGGVIRQPQSTAGQLVHALFNAFGLTSRALATVPFITYRLALQLRTRRPSYDGVRTGLHRSIAGVLLSGSQATC
jgi:hypothetical protein